MSVRPPRGRLSSSAAPPSLAPPPAGLAPDGNWLVPCGTVAARPLGRSKLRSGCLRPAGSGREPEGSTSLCLGEPSTRPARTCIPSAPSLPFRGPSWDGASCRGPDRSLRTRPALRREEDPSLPAPLASLAPEVLRSVQPRTFEDAANRREPFFFHRLAGGDRWLSPLPVRPVSGAAPVEAAAPDHLEKMT